MKADEVCEFYSKIGVQLTVRLLVDEEGSDPSDVLIEGSSQSLHMLAKILMAVAEESGDDGFGISPSGAGMVHFSKDSQLGIYIHRLPRNP